jgi:DNA-binding CsgD family transcriptional regulator
MARLAVSDYRAALEVLYAAAEVEGPLAFSEAVLETLHKLVPCDVVAFHERSQSADRVLAYTGEPLGKLTPEIQAAHRRLKHEDPLRPADGARKLTDFIPVREFRRRELYACVCRPLGVEYMLQLYLDPSTSDARLEFDRADCDFAERDRAVLDLLLPHLRQFLRVARRRRRLTRPEATVLTPRELEIIANVAEGRTNGEVASLLGISAETVRKHLEHVYEKLGVHTRTAAVAAVFKGNALSSDGVLLGHSPR